MKAAVSLPIHPETRIGELLDAYPGIDDALIQWVPAFSKLKNPILRKTVARVATLDQAARIGGIPTQDLVRRLREFTGQSATPEGGCAHHDHSRISVEIPRERPDWLRQDNVTHTVDAGAMLQMGEHPMGRMRQLTASLPPGGIVLLNSTFLPAPLIDALAKTGLAVYTEQPEPGQHATYFCRTS